MQPSKDKRGVVLLRTVLISLVLTVMLGLGLVQFMTGMMEEYDVPVDDNITSALSAFNETNMKEFDSWATGFQNRTQVEQGVTETAGTAEFTASSFQTIKSSFDLQDQVWDIVNIAPKVIDIPGWAILGLLSILTIVIVLAVVSPIFSKDT